MQKITLERPIIKIFVSHRTDMVSETINNPLYINVRSGAIYDKENKSGLLGDDTGDNISLKKPQYSELAVQYWAWKNVDADYYGLCHYRRYLSFSKQSFSTNEHDQISCDILNSNSAEKFGLLDVISMEKIISQNDLVVNSFCDIRKLDTPQGRKKNLLRHWKTGEGFLFPAGTIEKLLSIIKQFYPEYHEAFVEYLHGWKHRGYNCFIMKKNIFKQFCSFEFDVLSKLESTLDVTYYSETMMRTCAYMGEILYGAFVYYLQKKTDYKIKELKIVFFNYTDRQIDLMPVFPDSNVPVIINSNNDCIPYTAALIQSIIEKSNTKYNYDIIVAYRDIISENRQKQIEELATYNDNVTIRFLYAGVLGDDMKLLDTIENMLFLPWRLTKYNKAIVLNTNVIINKDIADFYKIDISGKSIGAIRDIVYQGFLNGVMRNTWSYSKDVLRLDNPYDYVNCDVLLMNLQRIRELYRKQSLLDFCKRHNWRNPCADILNTFFQKDIKLLDVKWNYCINSGEVTRQALQYAPKREVDKYRNTTNPVIINYEYFPKPWNDPKAKDADKFWYYLKKTRFYEEVLYMNLVYAGGGHLSFIRRAADKLLPKGTLRRNLLKKVMPRGSAQFEFLKKMYHKLTI